MLTLQFSSDSFKPSSHGWPNFGLDELKELTETAVCRGSWGFLLIVEVTCCPAASVVHYSLWCCMIKAGDCMMMVSYCEDETQYRSLVFSSKYSKLKLPTHIKAVILLMKQDFQCQTKQT